MLHFLDHFFALLKFPQVAQNDFRVWKNIPWADLGVNIYIPSKDHLIELAIHTQNALRNYKPNQGDLTCLFSLESPSCSIPHINSYSPFDEKKLNTLINSNNSNLLLSHNEFITPTDFVTLVEKAFYKELDNRINPQFKIIDTDFGELSTSITPNYNDRSKATFKRAFTKCRKYLNPQLNKKYVGSHFLDDSILNLDTALNDLYLKKLKQDLDNELINNTPTAKVMKI